MRRMPIEEAEEVERELPEFVDLVQGKSSDRVTLRIEDFDGDPALLYNCIRYALSCGKSVSIEPKG